MASKFLVSTLASILLIQTVYGQCGGIVQQVSSIPVGYNNLGVQGIQGLQGLQGLQLGNVGQQLTLSTGGCGGNLGNIGVINNAGLGYGSNFQTLPCQSLDALNIASGSSFAPSGISILADNLEIGGQVGISGSMPFYGAVNVNGNLPTAGQGQIQYNTAPGIGLTCGGCGLGLGGSAPNTVYNGAVNGLVGYGGGNVVTSNLGGLTLGNGCGCGCNLY